MSQGSESRTGKEKNFCEHVNTKEQQLAREGNSDHKFTCSTRPGGMLQDNDGKSQLKLCIPEAGIDCGST